MRAEGWKMRTRHIFKMLLHDKTYAFFNLCFLNQIVMLDQLKAQWHLVNYEQK